MSVAADYRALREGAAIGELSPRRQIAVAGADRAAYLQGLLTNDIQALRAGTGCYSAWLTPQGRMLTDLDVLESGDMILLDVPAGEADATLARLDQFLFSEDVQLSALEGALASVRVHGPAAAGVLQSVIGGPSEIGGWVDYQLAKREFHGTPIVVARIDQLGVPGFCVYVEPAVETTLIAALRDGGARQVSQDVIDTARVEAGYPVFGIDMTSETIPLEAGIEKRAISFSKGCYVGQEVIIRVLHRGHGRVARKLVGLRLQGEGVPAGGARVFADDRDVGWITSAAISPAMGPLALAYVHRDFLAAGTALAVQSSGERLPAVVSELPFTA